MALTYYGYFHRAHPWPVFCVSMLRLILHEIKIRIVQDEPFRAGRFEVHLDPCMRALSFAIQDDTVAELAVSHALAKADAEFRSGTCYARSGKGDMPPMNRPGRRRELVFSLCLTGLRHLRGTNSAYCESSTTNHFFTLSRCVMQLCTSKDRKTVRAAFSLLRFPPRRPLARILRENAAPYFT